MLQRHAKADGATVVLHVKGIAREPERLGEMVHGLSQMVEGVCEFPRVRPVTVSETRIIRRYQVVAIGKPCEKRFEHPRRRWKAVEQENRFRISRPSLAIEDRQAVNLCCAIERAIERGIHRCVFPSSCARKYSHQRLMQRLRTRETLKAC